MKRIMTLMGVALAALFLLPMQASATAVTNSVTLGTVYTGNTPDGAAPWLHADFIFTQGSKTGTLVLSSMVSDADFVQGLQNGNGAVGWAFYFNQTVSALECASGACASNYAKFFGGKTANTGPVPGDFNVAFGWSADNRFDAGDTATYTLTFDDALTGNPFVANAEGWLSVAHIQGITSQQGSAGQSFASTSTAGCSAWVVAGSGTLGGGGTPCGTLFIAVPEPGELGLFGFGLLAAGVFLGMRRRYN